VTSAAIARSNFRSADVRYDTEAASAADMWRRHQRSETVVKQRERRQDPRYASRLT